MCACLFSAQPRLTLQPASMYLHLWGRHTSHGNCQAAEPGLPQLKVIKEAAGH